MDRVRLDTVARRREKTLGSSSAPWARILFLEIPNRWLKKSVSKKSQKLLSDGVASKLGSSKTGGLV